MAKMHALPLATAAQQGIAKISKGLQLESDGVVGALRPISEIWVDPLGSDTVGDGAIGNPFQSIARAFSFILAHPLLDGYTIHLPAGSWQEDIGLPPPNTRFVGAGETRTRLSGVSSLAWLEGLNDAGALFFEDLTLVADISGRNGGNISVAFRNAALVGQLTLIGSLDFDACSGPSFSNLTNCSNVRIRNARTNGSTTLSLTYDPLTGTNGSGAVLNEVDGGSWGVIQYTSTDADVPLLISNAQVAAVQAVGSATINVIGSKVGTLHADSASCSIDYDGFSGPIYGGLGTFSSKELLVKTTVPANFDSGDISIPIPKQSTNSLKNLFFSSDLPGPSFSYVSSTSTSITVHVLGASSVHPAYELRVLVKL